MRGEGRLVLYFDGASRGNPGPASYGVWSPAGFADSKRLGTTTNNVAEYRALLMGLGAFLLRRPGRSLR